MKTKRNPKTEGSEKNRRRKMLLQDYFTNAVLIAAMTQTIQSCRAKD